MPLEMNRREAEGITILDLRGRLVQGPEVTALRERFNDLEREQVKNVILNFKQIDFIEAPAWPCWSPSNPRWKGLAVRYGSSDRASVAPSSWLSPSSALSFKSLMMSRPRSTVFSPGREVKRFDILEFVQSQEAPEPDKRLVHVERHVHDLEGKPLRR